MEAYYEDLVDFFEMNSVYLSEEILRHVKSVMRETYNAGYSEGNLDGYHEGYADAEDQFEG